MPIDPATGKRLPYPGDTSVPAPPQRAGPSRGRPPSRRFGGLGRGADSLPVSGGGPQGLTVAPGFPVPDMPTPRDWADENTPVSAYPPGGGYQPRPPGPPPPSPGGPFMGGGEADERDPGPGRVLGGEPFPVPPQQVPGPPRPIPPGLPPELPTSPGAPGLPPREVGWPGQQADRTRGERDRMMDEVRRGDERRGERKRFDDARQLDRDVHVEGRSQGGMGLGAYGAGGAVPGVGKAGAVGPASVMPEDRRKRKRDVTFGPGGLGF